MSEVQKHRLTNSLEVADDQILHLEADIIAKEETIRLLEASVTFLRKRQADWVGQKETWRGQLASLNTVTPTALVPVPRIADVYDIVTRSRIET
jgi:hypothetical protein